MPWSLVTCTVVTELRIILEERGMGWEYDVVYGEGPTGVEVGAVVMGIVVTGVMACRGGDGGLRGGVSRNIGKVVVVILLGVN